MFALNLHPRYRARLVALSLVVGTLALAPASAFSQDAESPAPSASLEPGSGQLEAGDLAALMPIELAGLPIPAENTTILRGQEIIETNPSAESQFEAVAAATGVAIDDMAQGLAYVDLGEGGLLFVSALQAPGGDAAVLLDVIVGLSTESMSEPSVEQTEIGGKPVTLVSDGEPDEVSPAIVYASGDTLWVVQGDDDEAVAEVLAGLPG